MNKVINHLKIWPCLAGVVTIFLGLSVVFGWYAKSIYLFQFLPKLPQIPFNTALSFVLIGSALLCNIKKKWHFSLLSTLSVCIIAGASLFQCVYNANLGIDGLFFSSLKAIHSLPPGKMAPNTALCFLLIGLSQILTLKINSKTWHSLISLIFCLLAFSISFVAVLGYFLRIETAYQWTNMAQMALYTAFGLVILSTGLVVYIVQQEALKRIEFPYWREILVCFLGLVLTFSLWGSLLQQEEKHVTILTKQRMDTLKSQLANSLNDRFKALNRIARRWEYANGTSYLAWKDDIKQYIQDQPDYQGIAWIDDTYHVRWYWPEQGNKKAAYYDVTTDPIRREALITSKQQVSGYVSHTLTLLSGRKGFIYFVPLNNRSGKFDGFIAGGYKLHALMDIILKKNVPDLEITILENEKPIYDNGIAGSSSVFIQDSFQLHGIEWILQLRPSKDLISNVHTSLPILVLIVGIFLSLLSSLVVFYVRISQQKSILLYQSEIRLNSAFQFSAIGMALVSLDGQWLKVNQALLKILGYFEDELLQMTFQAVTHPDDLDTDLDFVKQLLLGCIDNYQMEKRYLHKEGHYIWAQLNVSLVHNPDGKPLHFIAQIQDITERLNLEKASQEQAQRFEAIFNQTYQFIGLLSPQGILLEANQSAMELSGAQPGDVLGKPFWNTPWWSHSKILQKQVEEAVNLVSSGKFVRFEATHPTPSGDFITVDFSLKPLLDEQGEVILLIPEGRDITYIKQIEKEHQAMLAELHEAAKIRRNFVSTLTHDLRTPLIAQERVLNLLQKDTTINQNPELAFLVKGFLQNNTELLQMVNNLLVTYELEDGQIKPLWSSVDLHTLAQDCCDELQSVLKEKEISIENRISPALQPIDADEMLLKRLFRNLIGNAVANIPTNSQITLLASDWGTYIDVSVKDNGPGISDELMPYLFSRYLSGSTTRRKIGSGLGLYICKMISELHYGTIRVDSTPTTGTIISVTLPIQRPIS